MSENNIIVNLVEALHVDPLSPINVPNGNPRAAGEELPEASFISHIAELEGFAEQMRVVADIHNQVNDNNNRQEQARDRLLNRLVEQGNGFNRVVIDRADEFRRNNNGGFWNIWRDLLDNFTAHPYIWSFMSIVVIGSTAFIYTKHYGSTIKWFSNFFAGSAMTSTNSIFQTPAPLPNPNPNLESNPFSRYSNPILNNSPNTPLFSIYPQQFYYFLTFLSGTAFSGLLKFFRKFFR